VESFVYTYTFLGKHCIHLEIIQRHILQDTNIISILLSHNLFLPSDLYSLPNVPFKPLRVFFLFQVLHIHHRYHHHLTLLCFICISFPLLIVSHLQILLIFHFQLLSHLLLAFVH
jgi:hypothetical protein